MKKQSRDFSHGFDPERNMPMTLVMAWFRSGTRRWQKQSFAAAHFHAPDGAMGGSGGGSGQAINSQHICIYIYMFMHVLI